MWIVVFGGRHEYDVRFELQCVEILEMYCQHVRSMGNKVFKIVLYIAEIAGMAYLRLFNASVQSNARAKATFSSWPLAELWVLAIEFTG